jgi:hypothetical protein
VTRYPESLLQIVQRSELLDDEEVQKLVLAAGLSGNDHLQGSASKAVLGKSVQHWKYPFDRKTTFGEVRLGNTFRGRRFYLSREDLAKHLLAVGQSGSGKTTLFYSLMSQLEKPFWSFDLKQDYRHLVQDLDLLVLPWIRLKFNPLVPPRGVPPRRWAQVFSEVFCHATALLSGSKNYLLKQIIELYRFYNLFDEVSPPFPSLHELQSLIRSDKVNYVRTASDYRDRLLNRLEAMNLTAGTVFDCSQGYPIEELLKRNVVFEFDGLSRDVQNFLMEILFAYIYEYRLAQNHRGQGLNHVFFLDEGKRVFSVYKERQDASGIPEIDELTAKMREFGEGLVVADQEASKLTDSIKANTYTKVLLSTGDRKQFDAVAGSMNLSERQREYAQGLDIGEAIIQVGNTDPVPVRLEKYELEKQVSDEELEKRMAEEWSQLTYQERETTERFDQRLRGEAGGEIEIPDDPGGELELSEDADRVLSDAVDNPGKPLTQRYELLGNVRKGNEAKDELVDAGVIIEREVGTSEGQVKVLELTDKGRRYIEEELDLDPEQRGKGGAEHRYWQHRIKKAFEAAGHPAKIEHFDADVYVHMGDFELAIEVAMGNNPRETEHVQKHLGKDFVVWITAPDQEILDGLKQRVQENGVEPDQVTFTPLTRFQDLEKLPR